VEQAATQASYLSAVLMRRVDKMQLVISLTMLLYGISCMSLVHGSTSVRRTSGKLTLINGLLDRR